LYLAKSVAPGKKSTPGSMPFIMSRVDDVVVDAREAVAAGWEGRVLTLLPSSFFVETTAVEAATAVAVVVAATTAVAAVSPADVFAASSLIGVPTAFALK